MLAENLPLTGRTSSELEEICSMLSASECTDWTTEGAAELKRVGGGRSGASRLEGPVLGEMVNEGDDISA